MAPAGAAGSGSLRLQEFFRLGLETLAAARPSRRNNPGPVGEAVLCGRGIDRHAADRIDRDAASGFAGVAVLAAAAGVTPARLAW